MATNSRSSYQDILSEAWAQHLARIGAGCGYDLQGKLERGEMALIAIPLLIANSSGCPVIRSAPRDE